MSKTQKNTQLIIKPIAYEVAGQTVELKPETVINYLVRGNGNVTNQEVLMFMNLCYYQKLNPFINEAYLIKFGNQPAQIVVGKEAFMKRAEADPNFKGFDAGIIYEVDGEMHEVIGAVMPKRATLLGGWCKVYRSDREKPIEVRVDFDEFSKGQATWKDMPKNMIRKVAIVNALREAFPNTLGAMYSEEETSIGSAVDDIPEYRPQTKPPASENVVDMQADTLEEPDQDPQEEKENEEQAQIKKIRKEISAKFKQLGIPTKDQKTYLVKHVPNFKGTLAEYVGLSELLDMQIDMQSDVIDIHEDELPFTDVPDDEDTLE